MTLEEVAKILDARIIAGTNVDGIEVSRVCGADLMSDVLAFAKTGALLLTGLTTTQVVRTAEMAEIAGICFVRGKRPPEETVRLAAASGLPLLATPLAMFESCGRLHQRGLKGCSE